MNKRVAIIDDDKKSVFALEQMLEKYDDFRVVGKSYRADSGIKMVMELHPDVLFLDMNLPDGEGDRIWLDLAPEIDWPMKVVFYTAYSDYMLNAIRGNAFDFLLKPIEQSELDKIIERVNTCQQDSDKQGKFESSHAKNEYTHVFRLRNLKNEIQILKLENIGYFHYNSERKIWNVALDNGTSVPLKKRTTKETIVELSPRLVQIHPSYIINIDYLMIICENQCKLYPPFDNVEGLPISRNHKVELIEMFQGI